MEKYNYTLIILNLTKSKSQRRLLREVGYHDFLKCLYLVELFDFISQSKNIRRHKFLVNKIL